MCFPSGILLEQQVVASPSSCNHLKQTKLQACSWCNAQASFLPNLRALCQYRTSATKETCSCNEGVPLSSLEGVNSVRGPKQLTMGGFQNCKGTLRFLFDTKPVNSVHASIYSPRSRPKATVDSVLQSLQEAVHRKGGNLKNVDDKILLRFLQSKNQNVDEAARKFITYQKWRKSFLPLGYVPESTIESELRLKQSYLQGQDKKGHPVLVTFASKHEANKGDPEEYKRFLVYSFEKTLASAPEGVDKFVQIVDLKHLGFKNLDSAAFIAAFQILQDYYPDTLEKAFMINVPFIFYGLWKIVSPFLEEATRERIIFVDGNKVKETLLNQIDIDQLPVIYGGKTDLVLLQDAVILNYPTV
ncbi:hypothetical protein O6H91_17G005000 [Diphasiastrum complanatum]|uniref:Uncharacterized protein n=1 Tax=Diphasiastrum complanatum TaxID=34168 RepID=A0ACC2B3T4_DIPCM|nr:hypothetical protein O6H91_17G005000 [Diphasiastrum complanatum]